MTASDHGIGRSSTQLPMSIKSAEAHRLARELPQSRGVSITNVVTEALREKLQREKHRGVAKSLSAELLEIGKRCAAHIKRPTKFSHHAGMLCDQDGLPR
jgi:antitoxin VapB